jgi:hypothetical protein
MNAVLEYKDNKFADSSFGITMDVSLDSDKGVFRRYHVGGNPLNATDPLGLASVDVGFGVNIGPLDFTHSINNNKTNGSITLPGSFGAGGYICINFCSESEIGPSCNNKNNSQSDRQSSPDDAIEPLPFIWAIGMGRRMGISFTDDFCEFCFNAGRSWGPSPVNVGIPIEFD